MRYLFVVLLFYIENVNCSLFHEFFVFIVIAIEKRFTFFFSYFSSKTRIFQNQLVLNSLLHHEFVRHIYIYEYIFV